MALNFQESSIVPEAVRKWSNYACEWCERENKYFTLDLDPQHSTSLSLHNDIGWYFDEQFACLFTWETNWREWEVFCHSRTEWIEFLGRMGLQLPVKYVGSRHLRPCGEFLFYGNSFLSVFCSGTCEGKTCERIWMYNQNVKFWNCLFRVWRLLRCLIKLYH